jgi:hypothetical protein
MRSLFLASVLFASCVTAFGQRLIVTAEGHDGATPPDVNKDTVSVEVNRHPVRVEQWEPLRAADDALQLYIVIDDGTNPDVGNQFADLKNFINMQPPSTQVGLAYLRYGSAEIVAPLTADRAALIARLRIPLGQPGISSSPYMGVADLIKKWPAANARHEMLLISSGIDPWSPYDPQNPYLQTAITNAQRAGILIHSIYYAESGHAGHSYSRVNWGQSFLSELGDDTGGEAYWEGTHSPVSFAPYLKDLDRRLRDQYVLTIAAAGEKSGLQAVRATTTLKGVSLVAASKVYLPH